MKKVFLAVLILVLLSTIVGCAEKQGGASGEERNNQGENLSIKVVGKIVSFEKEGVHIMTGDVVEIFNVDKENMKEFYLGETVSIKKLDEEKFELDKYKINDFSVRYTSKGNLILRTSGKIKKIDNDSFTVSTEDGDFQFAAYDTVLLEEGTEVSVDYIEFNQKSERILVDIFNEDSKMELIVKKINRNEDGMMVVGAEDDKGLEYIVNLDRGTILNFNCSDLNVDDRITVYPPEVMTAIYPAEISAKMIIK